jgi:transketolase
MLHLSGYNLSIEDLKQFRQWGSKTPGHPEYKHTEGVEATTGPLGQGIAMGVGMAMAERHLASVYNKDNFDLINHYTYAICGDGDLMEGVSAEAASLAGHLKLGRLVLLYDSNDISLDGNLAQSFSESVKDRFLSYGWQYLRVEDGNNLEEIAKALEEAKADLDRPTMIEVRTVIGYGSPNRAGTSGVHGAPLGAEELKLTKEAYNWSEEPFFVPQEVYDNFHKLIVEAGEKKEKEWNDLFAQYKQQYADLANQLEMAIKGELPQGWDKDIPVYSEGKSIASRASSAEVLNAIAKNLPFFLGGSADLAGSNKTTIKGSGDFMPGGSFEGRNIWFGVREFAMGAAMNGWTLHGGVKIFGGTFFVFSDYLRPAIRLAALMGLPVTYVFTHDSIAVGEDGPTHEPIEQLAALRAMPNMSVIRPADANETAAAWKLAVQSTEKPTALVLTRQNLPTLKDTDKNAYDGVSKGAYVVSPAGKDTADALLLAVGSEVSLAVEAQAELAKEDIHVSVVSMPSWDRFDAQSNEYKASVLPKNVKKRLGIEMGSSFGWHKYVGDEGEVLAIDTFGASAPAEKILPEYGFSVSNVVARVKALLQK